MYVCYVVNYITPLSANYAFIPGTEILQSSWKLMGLHRSSLTQIIPIASDDE